MAAFNWMRSNPSPKTIAIATASDPATTATSTAAAAAATAPATATATAAAAAAATNLTAAAAAAAAAAAVATAARDAPAPRNTRSESLFPTNIKAVTDDNSSSSTASNLSYRSRSDSPASSLNSTTPHSSADARFAMPTTSPINIASPSRNASSSPSSQGTQGTQGRKTANFPDADMRTSAIMSGTHTQFDNSMGRGVQESYGGAKPISMNNPNRTLDRSRHGESVAGSLAGGMSWGGVSVGSWIRDDIMMAGTSPYPYQSPSFHSSSYLPKLEANFMRDFQCCDKTLPSLHDLLQHYEEAHAQQTPQSLRSASLAQRAREMTVPNSKAAIAAQAATSVQQQAQHLPQPQRPSGLQMPQAGHSVGGIQLMRQQQLSQPSTPTQKHMQNIGEDMDAVEDMEMDDAMDTSDTPIQPSNNHGPVQSAHQSLFGQQPRPALTVNGSGIQHSGLRGSQPPTPSAAGFGFPNNPTVSSVNTPSLTSQAMHQQQFSPHTTQPGTPAGELDDDFTVPLNMNMNLFPFGFGTGNDLGLDLCIDEPAKRLYSPNGGFNNQRALQQQFAQFGLGQGGRFANNDTLMRAYQHQQMLDMNGGNAAALAMMMGEEHKPFKCPVVGCEKAYKNQNGLKYHKTHGHQTQQLHENGDGTFSIVNPETSTPYPGTLGMEKEKPYKCDNCGKRYKNLNGLKYHRQHSPPCNPDFKLGNHIAGLSGLGVNVAGLPGIGEEGMML